MSAPRRGRPSRFAEYDQLVASLPPAMGKRPKYLNGIGVFRGSRGITAWLKIRLPNGGTLKGKTYPASASVEIKVGSLDSWSWDQLTDKHRELQGKADRGDPLEETPDLTFATFANDWLGRAESRMRAYDTAHIHVRKHLLPSLRHDSFAPNLHGRRKQMDRSPTQNGRSWYRQTSIPTPFARS